MERKEFVIEKLKNSREELKAFQVASFPFSGLSLGAKIQLQAI